MSNKYQICRVKPFHLKKLIIAYLGARLPNMQKSHIIFSRINVTRYYYKKNFYIDQFAKKGDTSFLNFHIIFNE